MIAPDSIIGGRYRVVKPLGGGGMKLVYLAEDLRLASRPCALAEMVDSFTNPNMQRQAVASFQREADMLAELSNEHIPRIYDRFSDQNRHYLVMEYVDGVTLEDTLKVSGARLEPRIVIDIAVQILDTLAYLHGLNPPVVYRDLKPSNVMFTSAGQVKLIDFGIARHFHPQSSATMIGTQGYAPPEQYRGKVETRSDLYALGATMHHALSGRDPAAEPPFSFPPLGKICPDLSPLLCELVDRALSYDVDQRIATAAEFKRRLLAVQTAPLGAANIAARVIPSGTATVSNKPQLPLPLSGSARTPSPSAETVLTPAIDPPCPSCGRRIPADSRFCSYCAADLRTVLGPLDVASRSEAETIVLGPEHRAPARVPPMSQGRRRWPRGSLIALFVLGFIGVSLGPQIITGVMRWIPQPEPGSTPDSTPPEEGITPPANPDTSEGPAEGVEPVHKTPRAVMLRRTLDLSGYRDVHFRLDGGVIELWGTVPTETDRLMVQATALGVSGVDSMRDHLKVEDSVAAP